jgi:15,16-dihydrobiliverdin:ferredoxin oxidoreductase
MRKHLKNGLGKKQHPAGTNDRDMSRAAHMGVFFGILSLVMTTFAAAARCPVLRCPVLALAAHKQAGGGGLGSSLSANNGKNTNAIFGKTAMHSTSTAGSSFVPTSSSSVSSRPVYEAFMETVLRSLESNFNLEAQPVDVDLSVARGSSRNQAGQIVNLAFSAPEFSRARMTYFNAGDAAQVFNMVIYPTPASDLPIFGMDLLSFGAGGQKSMNLAGIDFQPLWRDDAQYASRYTNQLASMKEKYPTFAQQRPSARFYDGAKFFSDHMLFGRYEDQNVIDRELFPAFCEYFATYMALLKNAPQSMHSRDVVHAQHVEYDQYNAERDPAKGLLKQYFGEEWSELFTWEFMFPLASRSSEY